MEESNLDFDQVKRYLSGEMNEEEKKRFEDIINNDPELARQVDLDRVLLEGVQLHYRGQLKDKLKGLDRHGLQTASPSFPIFRALAIAAGVALNMVVGFLVFDSKPDSQELYTTYFKPYYNVVNNIERGETVVGEDDPYRLYESGEYQRANELFEKLLPTESGNNQLIFYNGLSYLNSGFTSKAIDNLSQVAGKEDFLLSGTAYWYLGLAYLKENRIEEAIEAFTFLAEKENGYAARANEILDRLK